jgi:hypothetical protein
VAGPRRRNTRGCTGTGITIDLRPRYTKSAETADRRPQKRLAYKVALETFMARWRRELLPRLSDDAIAREFVADNEKRMREGRPASALPRDRRNIEKQVSKIRERKNNS